MIILKLLWWGFCIPIMSPILIPIQYLEWKESKKIKNNFSEGKGIYYGSGTIPSNPGEGFFFWFIQRNNIFNGKIFDSKDK